MVYEDQLEQIRQAREQLEVQREQLRKQREFLQNPNLLRKGGYGYLLGPAGKQQRIAALNQVQGGFQQLSDYETGQLNPSEQQILDARRRYQEQLDAYNRARREAERRLDRFVESRGRGNIYGTSEYYAKEAAKRPGQPLYINPKTGKAFSSFAELQKDQTPSRTLNKPTPKKLTPDIPEVLKDITISIDQPQEPQLGFKSSLSKPQELTPVTVRDFGTQQAPPLPPQKNKQGQGFSTAFGPEPTPENIDLNLGESPRTSPPTINKNPLLDYLASLKTKFPQAKPYEPEPLPPGLSFQTGFQRANELALNLPPTQLFRAVIPQVAKGYQFIKPYYNKYVENNPFLQAATLSQPITAAQQEVQYATERYGSNIDRIIGIPGSSLIISEGSKFVPNTPTEIIGTGLAVPVVGAIGEISPALVALGDLAYTAYSGYNVVTAETPEQRASGIVGTGLGVLGLGLGATEYLNRPVKLSSEPRPIPKIFTEEKTATQIKGDQVNTLASFTLEGRTLPEYQYYTTKGAEIFRKIAGLRPSDFGAKEISDLTLDELTVLQPKGKLVQVRPPSKFSSKLPASPVVEGKIQSIIRSQSTVGNREAPEITSEFIGFSEPSKALRLIDESKLDLETQRNLETIKALTKEKTVTNIPFETELIDGTKIANTLRKESFTSVEKSFFPKTELSTGEVITYDIFAKSKTKPAEIVPPGRRTRSGRLASVEESISKIVSDSSDFGLKEYEAFLQRFSFVDTTYPRVSSKGFSTKPRKAQLIQGKAERAVYVYPEEAAVEYTNFQRRELTPEEQQARLQSLIQLANKVKESQKAASAQLKQAEVAAALGYKVPKRISSAQLKAQLRPESYPTIVGGTGAVSQFAGLGQYEQFATTVFDKSLDIEVTNEIIGGRERPQTREQSRQIDRLLDREIAREIARTVPKEFSGQIPSEVPRQSQREVTRVVPREVPRISEINMPPGRPININYPREPYRPIPKIPSSRREKIRKRKLLAAYTLLLKRRGAFVPVAKGLPRGRALQLGASLTQRELSRQFKILESGITDIEDISFTPKGSQFRGYKQKRGQRFSTPDQFVQKLSNSLSSDAEKLLISQARRGR